MITILTRLTTTTVANDSLPTTLRGIQVGSLAPGERLVFYGDGGDGTGTGMVRRVVTSPIVRVRNTPDGIEVTTANSVYLLEEDTP